jgi:uncharacterized YceG family protein
MPDRDDEWQVDAEGNLTPPSDPHPTTDEFGRDDPATLERERRRLEREQRRRASKPRKQKEPKRKEPRQAKRRPGEESPQGGSPEGRKPLRGRISRGGGGGAEPPSESPGAKGGGGNFRRRRFAALALALVGILAVWFLVAFFQPFSGDGAGDEPVTVEIPEGASAGQIADILDQAGVVSSGRLFEWRLKLAGKSDEIQADTYSLASGMSYGAAIDALTSPAGPGGPITVSIPEGYDRRQIADLVLPEGVSSDEYLQLTERAPKSFNTKRYGATGDSLEGFLFPATYELPQNRTQRVPSLVDQQLEAFEDNIARVDMSYAKKKNLTVYDVLIIASMVDKEVLVPSERDDVAAVIYNRLSQGIPLGIDATTRFETGNYDEQITQAELDADTPFNTRLNSGLTPTPIGNPGLAAIKAAARPANVDYIYFVVDPGTCGEHEFTASEAEFERLSNEYQAALEAEGGSPTECPE